MQAKESDEPRDGRPEAAAPDRDRRARTRAEAHAHAPAVDRVAGLEDARREGEDQAVLADPKLEFPFYFPTLRVAGSRLLAAPSRAIYTIQDERGKKREAYRLVLSTPADRRVLRRPGH